MSATFRFRLEPVLEHRTRREELVRRELGAALEAAAAQRDRAAAARAAAGDRLADLRRLMAGPLPLADLRARHQDLLLARGRAAHEHAVAGQLDAVAAERRADLVRAGQDREALARLRRSALGRHEAERARAEADTLDEIALARARRGARGAT